MRSASTPCRTTASGTVFDADAIGHPGLRRLYDYWSAGRVGRALPPRAIVDPVALRPWLGNLSLVEVRHDPLRFRIRLCGSSVVDRIGLDLTGLDLGAIPDESYRLRVGAEFARIVRDRTPSLSRNHRVISGTRHEFELLRLPLSDDGETVSMLLICPMYFRDAPLDYALGSGRLPRFDAPICPD